MDGFRTFGNPPPFCLDLIIQHNKSVVHNGQLNHRLGHKVTSASPSAKTKRSRNFFAVVGSLQKHKLNNPKHRRIVASAAAA